MPPAAATAAARRSTAQPADHGPFAEANTKRAPQRAATVAAPARPARPAPQRQRAAPARPRTAPHTAPPAPARPPRTAVPRPIRVERPAPRSLRVQRPVPRVGSLLRLPRGGRLLDSIVRGRAWIPMLGVLLVGIVGMRVEVLKLGSTVGTEMQQASVLQSANAAMQSEVSALSNNQRIEQHAAKQGMVMPGPLDIHFVHTSGAASVTRAITDVSQPSPSTFLSGVVSERAHDGETAVTAATTSAIGVLGGGSIQSAPSSSGSSGTNAQTTATLAVTAAGGGSEASAGGTTSTADTSAAVGTSATQTQSSAGTTVTQGAPAATGSAPSGSGGSSAAADNVPATTSTDSNGAASLGG